MRLLAVVSALAIAGCHLVFPIEVGDDMSGPCVDVGHDEDGDGRDDACDPCPHLADATADNDGDGDGVGDGCDPRVDDPSDHRVHFDGFDASRGGYASFRASLTQDPDGEYAELGHQDGFLIPGSFERVMVVVRGWVIDLTWDRPYHEIGFVYGAQLPADTSELRYDGRYCHAGTEDLGPDYMDVALFVNGVASDGESTTADLYGFVGVEGPMTMWGDASTIRCQITDGGAPLGSMTSAALAAPGGVAVYVQSARIRLQYVLVIASD